MQMKKWSILALSIAAATSQLAYADENDDMVEQEISSQAASNGFFEDADLSLLNRNYAFYRDFNHGENDQNYRNEWAHGFMLNFTSGFTQGLIGFGADAFGQAGIKLNSGGGTGGTSLLPRDNDKNSQGKDEYGLAGGAVKARVSETVLAYGQQRPETPVFAPADSRLLPSWATGTSLVSQEISGLNLQAGHFYSGNATNSTNKDGKLGTSLTDLDVESADYVGGDYSFNEDLTVSLYGSEFQDVWRQYYAGLTKVFHLRGDMTLETSLNYYKTRDEGRAEAGKIDNNSYSSQLSLNSGIHTFSIAYQNIDGDTPFDYLSIDGTDGDSIYLANSVQYSDFNAANMKSYQARYDLDLSEMAVPGLSFMVRYVKGTGGDDTKADPNGLYAGTTTDGKAWERDIELKYVVQEGAAKDLSFRLRQATYRGNNDLEGSDGPSGIDEVRLITEYPLDIL